jgi:hypothetical protein
MRSRPAKRRLLRAGTRPTSQPASQPAVRVSASYRSETAEKSNGFQRQVDFTALSQCGDDRCHTGALACRVSVLSQVL